METPFTVTSRNFKITWNLKQIFITVRELNPFL